MSGGEDQRTTRQAGGRRSSSRLRRAGLVLGALALVVLVVAGYGFLALRENWFPFHSDSPREVSASEARRRFREHGASGSGGAQAFTPAAGVYGYRGSGSESLSNPRRSQSEGPSIPGTVTHRSNGCWRLRLDYSSNHYRRWDFCVRKGTLVEVGYRVWQRWDFGSFAIDNLSSLVCEPPAVVLEAGMTDGEKWPADCRGDSTMISGTTISTGTHRLVGTEKVDVGGAEVDAFHFRDDRTVSGVQSGTEHFDFWLAADGLLLKGAQRIEVESGGSPLGNVTYTQQSGFSLTSMSPQR
jgi:hypothetical protein